MYCLEGMGNGASGLIYGFSQPVGALEYRFTNTSDKSVCAVFSFNAADGHLGETKRGR